MDKALAGVPDQIDKAVQLAVADERSKRIADEVDLVYYKQKDAVAESAKWQWGIGGLLLGYAGGATTSALVKK